MSKRLDVVLAVGAWLLGFAWVRQGGSWAPLAIMACAAAGRLSIGSRETRELLRFSPRHLWQGVLGATVMIAATYVLYPLFGRIFPLLPETTSELYGVLNRDGYRVELLAALVLVISAAEEVVWRGRMLEAPFGLPLPLGLLGLSVIYGASHLTSGSIVLALLATTCGIYWGAIRLWTRSLWPALLTHVFWDLAVLVLWPLNRSA